MRFGSRARWKIANVFVQRLVCSTWHIQHSNDSKMHFESDCKKLLYIIHKTKTPTNAYEAQKLIPSYLRYGKHHWILQWFAKKKKKPPLICICIHRDHNNKKIYPLDTRIFVATGTAEHRWEKCVWFFFPIGILKSFVNKSGFCSFEQIPHTVWYYNFCMHHQLDRETQSMNLKGEKNLIIKSYSLG